MTLPKLVISGAEKEPTQYVKAAALDLGFQLVPTVRKSRASTWVHSSDHLVVWLTPQLTNFSQPLMLAENTGSSSRARTFIELNANVVFFYPSDLDDRGKKVDEFLREVHSGGISPLPSGQAWRGFVIPKMPTLQLCGKFTYGTISA